MFNTAVNTKNKAIAAARYIRNRISTQPEIAIILGSGLGSLGEEIAERKVIEYDDIPYVPTTTVEGHAGRLLSGILGNKNVLAMQGRFHYYEGYTMHDVTFLIRVMHILGIKYLIVSNAAGGVNQDFRPGDLMVIRDHINFMFNNPLRGPHDKDFGPRFPDLSEAYDGRLIKLAHSVANEMNISLQQGVYVAFTGPSYETPAEVRMAGIIGGDAVGMSTVPEVIVARQCGMKVLGISCITNYAAGIGDRPLSHEEVMETANMVREKFSALVKGIVEKI